MYYKLVSRDNTEPDILDAWPPVYDPNFTVYNNKILDLTFPTEPEIFTWLDSVSRFKTSTKMTNSQRSRNGDPNKIYAVYFFKNNSTDPNVVPLYLYSVKMIKPGDPQLIIISDTGERIKSYFKKYNVQKYNLFDRLDLTMDEDTSRSSNNLDTLDSSNKIIHSSDFRIVHHKYFEGIYPISEELGLNRNVITQAPNRNKNINNNRKIDRVINLDMNADVNSVNNMESDYSDYSDYKDYMDFVSTINTLDVEHNNFVARNGISDSDSNTNTYINTNTNTNNYINNADPSQIDVGPDYNIDYRVYDVIFSDESDKWIDNFTVKLEKIEAYLRLLAMGGKGQFNIRYNGDNTKTVGQHEIKRRSIIENIKDIMKKNVDMTYETSEDFKKISNFVSDPLLFDGKVYQVRYGTTLLTWHVMYSQIIKKFKLVPSKQFCIYVASFDISHFFKQNQSIETLTKIYENLASVYQNTQNQNNKKYADNEYNYNNDRNLNHINSNIRVMKKEPVIRKVTRSF